jgi:TfoX/Sxy family transcriptional regulator of competence genes
MKGRAKMAYNEILAERVAQALGETREVVAKKMMGGLTFMVDAKMCVGIVGDELMVRIDPEEQDRALKKKGCRVMDFTGKPMKGFVFVASAGTKSGKDLDAWIEMALDFNKRAKASKKTKKTKKGA